MQLDRTAMINLGLGLDYNWLKGMMDTPTFLQDMLANWVATEGGLSAGDRSANMEKVGRGLERPKSRPEWTCPWDWAKQVTIIELGDTSKIFLRHYDAKWGSTLAMTLRGGREGVQGLMS